MNADRYERVRKRAYERWEEEGRPEGRDMEHWLDAEREVPDDETASRGQQGISNHPSAEERREQRSLPPRGEQAAR